VKYSKGFKARMVRRMTGRDRISAARLSEEIGVSQPTLSRWLREAAKEAKRGNGVETTTAPRGSRSVRPEDLPPAEKLRLVKEAAELHGEELGAFLRRHGLHDVQLKQWEEAALSALEPPKKKRRRQSPEAKQIRKLQRELDRKDKALAEVTALLALKKKLEALFGEDEDDSTTRTSGR